MFYVPTVLVGYILGIFSAILFFGLRNVIKNFLLVDFDPIPGIKDLRRALRLPDLEILENPKIEKYGELTVYEGWMVVYFDHYNSETFEIDRAKPAYINLQGSTLRISYTKQRVLRKAKWDEKQYKKEFTHFHEFDIFNCRVKLLPESLKRSKLWSRRYPIYIAITDSTVDLLEERNDNFASFLDPNTSTLTDEIHNSTMRSVVYKLTTAEAPSKETPLYLFGRTDRQKENWFRRLLAASKTRYTPSEIVPDNNVKSPQDIIHSSQDEKRSQSSSIKRKDKKDQRFIKYVYPFHLESLPSQYLHFVSDYQLQVLTDSGMCILKPLTVEEDGVVKGRAQIEIERARKSKISPNLLWFNVFFGRIVNDVVKNPKILARIHHIIQKKMYRMGLPSFIEDIRVRDIKLGESVPRIHCASNPMLDERGIWANLEVTYIGDATVIFETKLKLFDDKSSKEEDIDEPNENMRTRKTTNASLSSGGFSEGEISDAESEENFRTVTPQTSQHTSQHVTESVADEEPIKRRKVKSKLLRCLNTVVRSKAFQCVSQNSCIKPIVESWSKTTFTLNAVLKGFSGTLTLNIPPAPSDRIFLGFHDCPYLHLIATPEMGHRNIHKRIIVNFIEKAILKHILKKLTLPNMINVVIPPMNGTILE